MAITIKNIIYSTKKPILKDISTRLKHNKMTAILGPSGCGKTTLLKIISGRFTNKYEGKVLLNNKLIKKDILRKITAYVHQDDNFIETQTVLETIDFVVKLKNKPVKKSLIQSLNLTNILNTKIGNSNKGISAGERKRLSILLELIDDCHILFLDEPTSGLDSLNAVRLIELLKSLQMTTCCVLHQPSANIFFMFDEIIVMNEGKIVYQGSPDSIFDWFLEQGKECPKYYNPAEFIFTDILPNLQIKDNYNEVEVDQNDENNIDETNYEIKYKNRSSIKTEIKVLSKRLIQTNIRDKARALAKLGQSLFTAFIISSVFYNTYKKNDLVIQKNLQGLFYFYSINFLFSAAFSSLADFYQNEKTLQREYQAGYYRFVTFFITKIFFDTLLCIIHPILIVSIVSIAIKYQSGIFGLFIIYLTCILTVLTGYSISVLAAACCPTITVASIIIPTLLLPLTIINGSLVDPESMFFLLKLLQYISPTRYAFNILIKNEFRNKEVDPMTANLIKGFLSIEVSLLSLLIMYILNMLLAFFLLGRRLKRSI